MDTPRTAAAFKEIREQIARTKQFRLRANILAPALLAGFWCYSSVSLHQTVVVSLTLSASVFGLIVLNAAFRRKIRALSVLESRVKKGVTAVDLPKIAKWNAPQFNGATGSLILGHEAGTGESVYLDDRQAGNGGILVAGSTGCGKTSFLLGLLFQQLRRGKGCIYIDAKGSKAALQKVIFLCRKTGRLSDLLVLNPSDPTHSHSYNPLLTGDVDLLTSKIIKILPVPPANTPAAHFYRMAENNIRRIVVALKETGMAFSYDHIRLVFENPDKAIPILQKILAGSKSREGLIALQGFINQYRVSSKSSDVDPTKASYDLSSLIAQLSALSSGDVGSFLCGPTSDIDLVDILQKGKILFINLPALGRENRSDKIGQAFMADLQATCAYFYENIDKKRIAAPFPILADEFANYVTTDYAKIFQMARELGVITIATVQTFANLTNRDRGLNQDFMTMVMGNTYAKVFFGAGDAETAEIMSKHFGEELAPFEHFTKGETRATTGQSLSIVDRFLNPKASAGHINQTGAREAYDWVIRPEVFQHEISREAGMAVMDIRAGRPIVTRCVYPIINDFDWMRISVADELPRFAVKSDQMLNLRHPVESSIHVDAMASAAKVQTEAASRVAETKRQTQRHPQPPPLPDLFENITPQTLAESSDKSNPTNMFEEDF